jgi:starvation-inducible outer membrane lipoprotein
MRASFLLLALLPACVLAQATIERETALDPRKNQKIERIQIEDAGNRIEELRVGGQTQNITVQPKSSNMPAYEMQPDDMGRSRPSESREGFSGRKQRVWNVLGF